jgi:hypothetical protein
MRLFGTVGVFSDQVFLSKVVQYVLVLLKVEGNALDEVVVGNRLMSFQARVSLVDGLENSFGFANPVG